MKLRVDIDGRSHVLEMRDGEYTFDNISGTASVEEVRPGVFSILLGTQSFRVNVEAAQGEQFEVVSNDGARHLICVADTRDRLSAQDAAASKGPAIIRAQMPGKIVRLLVEVGAAVNAGQGLIVVEAMKMQNEVKAPKGGVVVKILAQAGTTVAAGETLIVVE